MSEQLQFVAATDASLSEVIDRILHKGVVIAGDLVLSVAGVDLVYCEIRVLLISMAKYEQMQQQKYELDEKCE